MPEYETIGGTEPQKDAAHAPRTMRRVDVGPEPGVVDLNQWEPGEDVDADAAVRDELAAYRRSGDLYMMSEIGDGVFVQWGSCATCRQRVATCTCADGPHEPGYITEWRDKRFDADVIRRIGAVKRRDLGLPPGADLPTGYGSDEPDAQAIADAEDALRRSDAEVPSDTRRKVDDGLDDALARVRAAKQSEEDNNDVGF